MYFIALATDYDGTLAHRGRVDEQAIAVLEQLKASGRYLLMVTGRELPDLKRVFDRLELFDVVVAENGALLYFPKTQEERSVAAAPPSELVNALRARGVKPLSVGKGAPLTPGASTPRSPHTAQERAAPHGRCRHRLTKADASACFAK
jgi:hydroxymethylpyrimidine pyrophosphatase-like HAD family hydrolase